MTFTEEDADNDGMIKREVGEQLNSVLARKNSKLYQLFLQYCEENGRDPSRVLGDMALRAMRNEGFAKELSGTVVDVGKLQNGSAREEDLDMVLHLIEKLDGAEDDKGGGAMNSIDRLIEQRIEAMGQGPLGGIGNQGGGDSDGQSGGRVDQLEQRLARIEQAVTDGQQRQSGGMGGGSQSEPEETQDVDDLFDDVGEEEETQEGNTEVEGDGDGTGDQIFVPGEDEGQEPVFSTEEADEE